MDVSVEESGLVSVAVIRPSSADESAVQEAEELNHVPAPVLPSKAQMEALNVLHLPFRSWCSACVRGRELSLGHRRVDMKIPTVSVDSGFFVQPEDKAHNTLQRDRKSKGIWSHPMRQRV